MSLATKQKKILLGVTVAVAILIFTIAFIYLATPSTIITRTDTPHYNTFKKVFTEKMHNKLITMLGDGDKSGESDASVFKNRKDDIIDIVTAVNYQMIFITSEYGDSLISKSTDTKIKEFDIAKADAVTAGKAIEAILTSPNIISQLVLTHAEIQSLSVMDFSGFKISKITEAFCIFKSATKAVFSNTGIKGKLTSLYPLKNLKEIYAMDNDITEVENMEKLEAFEYLNLNGNNITKIETGWLDNVKRSIKIFLKPKRGMKFGNNIHKIAEKYKDKIFIEPADIS